MEFKNLKKVVEEERMGFTETLEALDKLIGKEKTVEIATGLALLDARQESAEEKSRRRSALKYEYFRTMTPYGNI